MATTEERYLREVLGLQSIVVPEGHEDQYPVHFDVYGDFSAPVAVVSFSPLDQNQRDLAQKMLKAVGVTKSLCIEFKSTATDQDWTEFKNAFEGRAVWFCGDCPEFAKGLTVPHVELPELSCLLDQSDSALMQKKKEVWNQLKSFHAGVKV